MTEHSNPYQSPSIVDQEPIVQAQFSSTPADTTFELFEWGLVVILFGVLAGVSIGFEPLEKALLWIMAIGIGIGLSILGYFIKGNKKQA